MAYLSDTHREYLKKRGVADDVAKARGYRTIFSPSELPAHPWSDAQVSQLGRHNQDDGALVIPIFGHLQDDLWAPVPTVHQLRFENPRLSQGSGKPIKFELPAGCERGTAPGSLPADIHPMRVELAWGDDVWEAIAGTPEEQLWLDRGVAGPDDVAGWVAAQGCSAAAVQAAATLDDLGTVVITEGVVKGDAILSAAQRENVHRVIPVSITGVDMAVDSGRLVESLNWIDDRFTVVIAFDADWRTNPNVANAIRTLRDTLEARPGTRYPCMIDLTPHLTHPTDGIDDVLAGGVKLRTLLAQARRVHHYIPYPGRMLGEDAQSEQVPADGSQEAIASRLASAALGTDAAGALRWDESTAKWLRWDGSRWTATDGELRVRELARMIAEKMAATVELAEPKAGRAVARTLRSSSHRRGVLDLARGYRGVPVRTAEWDQDPMILVTPSGVVDLASGAVRPAALDDRVTLSTGIDYRPASTSELWDSFLAMTFGGDSELTTFIQRLAGACAIGVPTERLFWLLGGGADGKSTLTGAIESALGEYARTIDPEALLGASSHSAEYSRAALRGCRYLRMAEARAEIDAVLMKRVTSTDPVTGRHIYGSPISFAPTHTSIVTSNRRPVLSRMDADRGTFRRLTIVPFLHTVPPDRMDLTLGEQLRRPEHVGAVLAWIVQGAVDHIAAGLRFPKCAAVETATEEVVADIDLVGEWIDDMLVADPTGAVPLPTLATVFHEWLRAQGRMGKESHAEIGRRVVSRINGSTVAKSDGRRLVRGVSWSAHGRLAVKREFRSLRDIGTIADARQGTGGTVTQLRRDLEPDLDVAEEVY